MKKLLHLIVLVGTTCFAQTNWTASNSGLPNNAYVNAFTQASNGDLFIAVNANGQGHLLKSTDGTSWTSVTTAGLPSTSWAGSLFTKNNKMFLGANGSAGCLFASTDNGQNWTISSTGIPANAYVNGFAQGTNGDIYAIANVSGLGQLFKSADNGSSWSSVSTNGLPSGGWAGSIFSKGNTMFIGSGGLGSFLYASTDNGQNWSASNTGLPANAYVNDFAQTTNGDIYTIINANAQGQLLVSTDNGASWSSVSTNGLPSGGWAGSLFSKGNTLFIGTGGLGSLLYRSTVGTTGMDENALANSICLFPNPSNGEVYISSLSNIDFVQIVNTTGQLVYEQKANGNQFSFLLDKPGIYFVTITIGDKRTTNTFFVVR